MRQLLETLLDGEDLTVAQAEELLRGLTHPEIDPALKGALLAALRAKGETPEEICGMARGMRDAARPMSFAPEGPPVIDTCGTGGDGSHAINISTAAALVCAGAGLRVVKHGNRSVSSKSGSADVLEALGIVVPTGPRQAEAQLVRCGFTFLFAPHFHPAMKAVVPVRRAMGVRTVFNLLGPLTNPARPPFQVVGAFSVEVARKMAGALSGLGAQRCSVVHGTPGWDEATPCGPYWQFDVTPGNVVERQIDPLEHFGVPRCAPEDLTGGEAADNALALRAVFAGHKGPHRDAILLNAAIALETAGQGTGVEAYQRAAQAIDGGHVSALLNALSA
jgi:anthranilate phosphoribosyltransferase